MASSSVGHPKTAIVTGSARGIGKAIALRLASDGYDVTIADIPAMSAEAEAAAKEIAALGRKSFVALGDVSVRANVESIVAQHVENVGPLFTMVANAGICEVKSVLEVTEEDIRKMYDVNVFGVFNCYQVAAKQLIKQGTPGRLIAASSIVGFKPFANMVNYSSSKWAVRGLTQGFAMEMAQYGIRVNAYAPGIHATKMWEQIDSSLGRLEGREQGESLKKYSKDLIALGRTGESEDVAKLVSFLASDDSEYMTGQNILVDGGIVFT
ncbi:unnamed protein product [Clonostachys rosea]|uniref:Diacetyl reductase [(S)-acetoin forming] n=1 Tax=Bionectria ochroleuca TaxID=29856 RepID=A0ABY6UQ27_BIOOC|nr:unnamed protein product [Clonostachys rosea]